MKQIVQPNTQQSTDTPSTNTLYLFIYPLLIPNGLIKIIVIPYLKDCENETSRDTDPSTRGMANPSGLNRLRTRVFKGKAISDCNSPAIASTYQHSDWKLWPQSDNPRRVRDALQYDNRDRLKKRGKLDYSYDDNGSLTSISHTDNGLQRSFIYNLENRLIQVKDGQGQSISTYQYDPFGRRISKTVGTVTTYYFYSAEGLIAELDNNGKITTQYGYRPDGTWGTNPLYIKQKGYTGYYQNDHLGTPQQIISSSGQILWNAHYSAFGQASVTTNVITNNLRLAGQYFDAETGLHYNYFRYYDPAIGRYLTSDPIGLLRDFSNPQLQMSIAYGGLEETGFAGEVLNHLYGYVSQNPLTWVDPFGLAKSKKPKGHGKSGGTTHKKNATPSNRPKHQGGDANRDTSRGREKGDKRRGHSRRRPKGYKGKWPPGVRSLLCPICPYILPDVLNPPYKNYLDPRPICT